MKKHSQIINKIKPVLVATLLLVGFVFVAANNWSAPTANPINSNTKAPVDEGTDLQEKAGTLTVGALSNTAYSPVVTYGPLYVGINDGTNYQEASTTFYGPLNLIKVFSDAGNTTNAPLCTTWQGKVKVCSQDVTFEPVQEVYYTATYTSSTTVSFPSGGFTGYVRYKIDPALTCTTISTNNTSWDSVTTLTGSSNNHAVTFTDWGTYQLSMSCSVGGANPKTYSVVMHIRAKIAPTAYNSVQSFKFPSQRTLTVYAQAGGATGSSNSGTCANGVDGNYSFVHASSSSSWSYSTSGYGSYGYDSGANLVQVNGGIAPKNWGSNHCGQSMGDYGIGGPVETNNLSSKTSYSGGNPGSFYGGAETGGCPGSLLGTNCNGSDPGTGGTWSSGYGGGGGAYASGLYQIAQNNYVHVLQGAEATFGSISSMQKGKAGSVLIEFE